MQKGRGFSVVCIFPRNCTLGKSLTMLSDVLHKLSSTISNQWTWWGNVINEKDELARAVLTISIMLLSLL
ncbi:hypothetical protein RHSIM_Rhsim07G0102100 [Rhododendron simsii]|uniref:Uncharacterized protein n=1 Tax=Rhododendron simsii TaxID=118357 RepID=A0A834LIT4_RHOSS|nr:hypothetical protein RHSIM_Rhsim07G0102100 [Rhododendron simsii]